MPNAIASDESTLWEGRPSHKAETLSYICWLLISPAVVPLFFVFLIAMNVNSTHWTLTSQRLRRRRGWLNVRIDEVELYRIKSISVSLPWFYRMFGVGTVNILTSDKLINKIELWGVENAEQLAERIRVEVERVREQKNVREVDNA